MTGLKVLSYQLHYSPIGVDVVAELARQRDGSELWAIREGGCCLNKKGEWEHEPIPSSRTKSFLMRCRWKSAEAAAAFWKKYGKSRFEHYDTAQVTRAKDGEK